MLGGIGDAHVGQIGQFLHRTRRLHKQIDQFQAVWICQRAADLSKQFIQMFFVFAGFSIFEEDIIIPDILIFNRFIEYYKSDDRICQVIRQFKGEFRDGNLFVHHQQCPLRG